MTRLDRHGGGRTENMRPHLSPFACADCSYGASARVAPERCPVCNGSTWELEPWRPFRHVYRSEQNMPALFNTTTN